MKNFKTSLVAATLLIATLTAACQNAGLGNASPKTAADTASYYLGYLSFNQFNDQGMDEFSPALVAKGWQDAAKNVAWKDNNGKEIDLNAMNNFMQQFFMNSQADAQAKVQARIDANKQVNQEFLETNKTKEGVVVRESGLQYKVLTEGTGEFPTREDRVRVHYHGTLIDGTVFDSSVERGEPAEFEVAYLVPGFTEALTLMPVGSKWQLYIPSDLAYGDMSRGKIKGGSTLIFDLELLEIIKPEAEGEDAE